MRPLDLWGGVECTINRVHDQFHDQLLESGHYLRAADLGMIAKLGVKALRLPILWENVAPENGVPPDWRWADAALMHLRDLKVRPIAGLVHHGSGPRHTNLLSDSFAVGLASYAAQVAERYPWITDWTPVNEPLTTARFSALYGHWYPHLKDERSFWIALLNQIDGIRFAMKAIRAVQPAARLVQTDDLGRTYATAMVRDQAAFDNVRRWMGWDLLCGRVRPGHDFWKRLVDMGLEKRLWAIADDPCPPDVMGINHYLTSDRFLDHRVRRYPAALWGGSGQRAFVDTEAVRVLEPSPSGLQGALREAWQRYGIPIAITEVHNGCTREEQMRWTAEAWRTAESLRADGLPIEAVTSWALLGNQGWDQLLTGRGRYEAGAFDIRSGTPRPTALAPLLTALASGARIDSPMLQGAGWWRRKIRLQHPPVARAAPLREHYLFRTPHERARPILITGATGTLGQAIAAACRHRAIDHVLTARDTIDLTDRHSIEEALDHHAPWAVIDAVGWVRVDDAEHEEEACFATNAAGASRLAAACDRRGIPTVTFSSDLVFDGHAGRFYTEADTPSPLNAYGRSKAEMEHAITALPGQHLIVRTAAFFSPFDPHNFAAHVVEKLQAGTPVRAAADQMVSPTFVPDLCDATLDLLIDGEIGIWHLTNGTAISWASFAKSIALSCGLKPMLIEPVPGAMLNQPAPRPSFTPLASMRGQLLPPLTDAIHRFALEVQGRRSAAPGPIYQPDKMPSAPSSA